MRTALPLLALLPLFAGCSVDRTYRTPATPQRPTFSSNTNTTAPGTIELEAGVDTEPGDSLGLPTTIKYGVDERTELFLDVVPYSWIDFPDGSQSGFGDIAPGIRRRLVDQDGSTPAVGYRIAAKIPTASSNKGLGTGRTDLFFAGIATWDDPAWSATAYYELGLLGEVEDSGIDLQHLATVQGSRPLQDELSAFGEVAFRWAPEQDREELFALGGLAYAYRPGMVFDAGLRLGLTDDAQDFAILIGTTINFGRQKWRIRP